MDMDMQGQSSHNKTRKRTYKKTGHADLLIIKENQITSREHIHNGSFPRFHNSFSTSTSQRSSSNIVHSPSPRPLASPSTSLFTLLHYATVLHLLRRQHRQRRRLC